MGSWCNCKMRGTLRLLRVTWETKMYLNLKNSEFCKRVTTRKTGLCGDWPFLGQIYRQKKQNTRPATHKESSRWEKIVSFGTKFSVTPLCVWIYSLFHQLQRAPTKQPHCKRLIKSHSASHLLYSVSLKWLSNQGFPSSLFFILLINIRLCAEKALC